jgi:hypothetical protein
MGLTDVTLYFIAFLHFINDTAYKFLAQSNLTEHNKLSTKIHKQNNKHKRYSQKKFISVLKVLNFYL